MCENKEIKRIKQGYYHLANQNDISDEQMIAFFFEEGIICMDSALFHYGHSDRTPVVCTISISKKFITNIKLHLYFLFIKILNLCIIYHKKLVSCYDEGTGFIKKKR